MLKCCRWKSKDESDANKQVVLVGKATCMAFRNGIDVNPYRFGPFLRGQDNTEYSNHLEWYKVDYRPVATGETFGELSEPRN